MSVFWKKLRILAFGRGCFAGVPFAKLAAVILGCFFGVAVRRFLVAGAIADED